MYFVIHQRKISTRDWSKSRHVTFTNAQYPPTAQPIDWPRLINVQDVYDHANDTRLASCIVAILYVVVSCCKPIVAKPYVVRY